MRQRPKPVKSKAKVPVAPKSPKDEDPRVRDLEKRLAEALKREAEAQEQLQTRDRELVEAQEQQTATSEVLRIISASPAVLQPVLDTLVANAARVCGALDVNLHLRDGDFLPIMAHYGVLPVSDNRFPVDRSSAVSQAVLDRQIIHIHDIATTGDLPAALERARRTGYRTILAIPLLRGDSALGGFVLRRAEVHPFSDNQIDLLKTFADQAVIAIENVRLFNELQASNRDLTTALDKQTATSDILRVISRSQTDAQPVFDAILSSAIRLMGAYAGVLTRVTGDSLDLAAFKRTDNAGESTVRAAFPLSLQSEGSHAKAVRDRTPVNIAEAQTDAQLPEAGRSIARAVGYQSMVVVPVLRHNVAVGTISAVRREPGGFSDDELALLRTFADQAVIAIENVRLFTELEARNRELSSALDRQTATADVLRIIAQSPTELQPVLDAIAASAVRLCAASDVVIERLEGDHFYNAAHAGTQMKGLVGLPLPLTRGFPGGRAVLDRKRVVVDDFRLVESEFPDTRELNKLNTIRSLAEIPLLSEGRPLGSLAVLRGEVRPFTDVEINLLQAFADQAVIAIENVRLFHEIEAKSHQLEVASQHKSDFLANMSHELRTPLNAIIGFSEVLSERMFGELNEKQEEYLKDIYSSGTHLLSLINDILDLSKIEAGRMELELTDFHLPTALDNATMLIRERAGRRAIGLQLSVDERLGEVRADERKIRQVVLNLLSNAIKFTPEGGRIDVGAVPKDGSVEVSVSDTGVGIAPEDQEAVFEEFRQVGTAEKKAEGTGLGLTLCRKFIELHGGRIWVKSQVGWGSTFTFTIPARRGE